MLLRTYTGRMSSDVTIWLPLCAYGFIGIFIRIFNDWYTFKKNNRKNLIYLALFIQIVTFIPILFCNNNIGSFALFANVLQSIGVGVGASCIGCYQLFHNEQYGKSKHFLTISLMSIPPIIATFFAGIIGSIFESLSKHFGDEFNTLKYMWLFGILLIFVCFVLTFFLKENTTKIYLDNQYKTLIKTKNEWAYFILILIIGLLVAFIKFADSGALANIYLSKISNNALKNYSGYLIIFFSIGQLIGGILSTTILLRKIGRFITFSIGILIWIIYHFLVVYTRDPYIYFGIHILNGLAYGIVYNLLIGFVLEKKFLSNKISPTALAQGVFSVGIFFGTFFVAWLTSGPFNINNDNQAYLYNHDVCNYIIIGICILILVMYFFATAILKKKATLI